MTNPCPVHGTDCQPIQAEGEGSLGVLVIGEAAGATEAAEGLPFRPRGESGAVLERCWRRLGLSRSQFRITNVVNCQPPGNKLEGAAYKQALISHWREALDREVANMAPRCILALGGVAAEQLTGMSGRRQGVSSIRGFVLNSRYAGIPVVCSLHPAFLRRGKMSWLGILLNDITLAVKVAREGRKPLDPPMAYQPRPSVEDARQWLEQARGASLLAYDIETRWSGGEDEQDVKPAEEASPEDGTDDVVPEATSSASTLAEGAIELVQFSHKPGQGIALLPQGDYIPIIKEALTLPMAKSGFNSRLFDNPKLEEAGWPVGPNQLDVMWQWHHLQPDLPRSLQAVASFYEPEFGPWKHESGTDLALYGCKDVDILQRIAPKIEKDLREAGLLEGFERYVRGFASILDDVGRRGLPVDPERQRGLIEFLDAGMVTADAKMQAEVPKVLLIAHPKEGYVKDPQDTTGLIQRSFITSIPVKLRRHCDCVDLETGEVTGWTKATKSRCTTCRGLGFIKSKGKAPRITTSVIRYARLLPFRPSPHQLIPYIRYRGHKVPKAIGENRETTGKLQLERLFKDTKDPLYGAVLEWRAMQKMRTSYIWSLGPDNRVHPTFTNSPATGQLAAISPNVMTIPAPKGKSWKDMLAVKFRETIAARPGYTLLEVDASGFHTSTFALEARDADYFRLANKIRDPHSFLTAIMLGQKQPQEMLALDDDALVAFLNATKKAHKALRDGQAKPAILGFALGLGGNKLYEQNRFDADSGFGFKSKRAAERLIEQLRAAFSRCRQYQIDIIQRAASQGFLQSPYGFRRIFWDVLHRNPRTGETEPGEQAEAAIAFLVQCNAHGYLKDAILRMQERDYLNRYNLINIVHDSVVFEVENGLLMQAIDDILEELERPSGILKDPVLCPAGLIVKAEAKWGPDMATMKG